MEEYNKYDIATTALQLHMRETHFLPCDTARSWYVESRHKRDHMIHPHLDHPHEPPPPEPGTTRALVVAAERILKKLPTDIGAAGRRYCAYCRAEAYWADDQQAHSVDCAWTGLRDEVGRVRENRKFKS